MRYTLNMFRSLIFDRKAYGKLHKEQRAGTYWFFGLIALFTFFTLPLVAVLVSLRAIYGGGGPLVQALPTSLPLLLIVLFVIYFIVFSAVALFYLYALHLFNKVLGGKGSFMDLLAASTPALVPYSLMMIPMFAVLLFGFFGGVMSDTVGNAIGIFFNILLVVLPILSFIYTLFAVRVTAALSWSKAVGSAVIAVVLTLMFISVLYLIFSWLI